MTGDDVVDDNHTDLKRDLTVKLTVIVRRMRSSFNQSVEKLGVTRSQWSIIAVVSRFPGSTQRTIAEALEISEAAAGRLIDRLCAEGFLERQARDDDRRAYSVHLTPATVPHMNRMSEIARENEAVAFAGMSDDDLSTLDALLMRIYDNMGGQPDRLANLKGGGR